MRQNQPALNSTLPIILMKFAKIIIALNCLLLVSCVSRLSRPVLIGTITDFNGKPIKNCSVGESFTDKNGKFTLSEIRYNQFLLTEIFQMEAPPLMVSEIISKKGYEPKEIYAFSTFGGSGKKGSKWDLGTIRLKSTNNKLPDLSNSNWQISTNKEMDSVYFIRSNFHDICKTRKCNDFYYYYNQYSDNYLSSSNKNNLPLGVSRKLINVNFESDKNFSIEKITQYGNKDGSWGNSKENDTVTANGAWGFNEGKNTFTSNFNELNGVYEIAEFDYEYILMIKTTGKNGYK